LGIGAGQAGGLIRWVVPVRFVGRAGRWRPRTSAAGRLPAPV